MEKDYNDGFYDKSSKYGNKENRYSGDKNDRFFDRDRYNRDNRDDYHHHRDYRKDKRDNERSSGGRERHNSYRSNRHDSESVCVIMLNYLFIYKLTSLIMLIDPNLGGVEVIGGGGGNFTPPPPPPVGFPLITQKR